MAYRVSLKNETTIRKWIFGYLSDAEADYFCISDIVEKALYGFKGAPYTSVSRAMSAAQYVSNRLVTDMALTKGYDHNLYKGPRFNAAWWSAYGEEPCRVCNYLTIESVNIRFKRVPLCERCATTITLQQVDLWGKQTK